jgi:hypothetical protein
MGMMAPSSVTMLVKPRNELFGAVIKLEEQSIVGLPSRENCGQWSLNYLKIYERGKTDDLEDPVDCCQCCVRGNGVEFSPTRRVRDAE